LAGVYKRKSDKARGARGKWTAWWLDAAGKRRTFAGSVDKAATLRAAQAKEAEALLVREGVVDPAERGRREASLRPAADHVEDYRQALLAKGDTARHARHTASTLRSLLTAAAIGSVADLAPDRIAEALGRLRATRSARTANFSLQAIKAFSRWLFEANRIKEVPRGITKLRPYSSADRVRVRRALTLDELTRLFAAAVDGPVIVAERAGRGGKVVATLDGSTRAALYRLAAGTGFRANEIRQLTRECFHLDGPEPTIVLPASAAKNGREAVQPIARALADQIRPFVERTQPGERVFPVPEKTADLIRADLARAGVDAAGVDFHALRHTFVTHLIDRGADVKTAQTLARHSTPTLTIGIYTHARGDKLRAALEDE
jgi:integrase